MTFKKIIFLCFVSLFCFGVLSAQEVTVVFTGQTHAALYHCNCPIQPDGGLSRRATFIKELRKDKPDLLLLECGNFTAGGIMDEYSQGPQLDIQRSRINVKAMETMRYDACAVGPDELNFGEDFLISNIRGSSINFLSNNLHVENVVPYLIKDVGSVRIGLIGLTGSLVGKKFDLLKPPEVWLLKKQISKLKKRGAQVIILLSTLGETEDLKLLGQVQGIDLLFVGGIPAKDEKSYYKSGSTLVLRPTWQSRHIGKLTLNISKQGKITDSKVQFDRLSDKIADDQEILSILPACFSDSNCNQEGFIGTCANPAAANASCVFVKPNKVELLVISSKECRTCNSQPMVNFLKQRFPGLVTRSIYYPDKESAKLIKDFSIPGLPAYLLGKEAGSEKGFQSLKDYLQKAGEFYLLKPLATGISYFQLRKKIPARMDLFLSLSDPRTVKLLENTRGFNPQTHFVLFETKNGLYSVSGEPEIKADKRAVCVQKYYPQEFSNYLLYQAKNFSNAQKQSCLSAEAEAKVSACAVSDEAKGLLRENIALTKELQVIYSPTYLLENRDIFFVNVVPQEEEIKKIINKR